jgi:lauroyl/myristoyl acyltransferase
MPLGRRMRRMRQFAVDRTIAAGAHFGGILPDSLLGLTVREAVMASRLALRPILHRNLLSALGPAPRLRQAERDYFTRAAEWARFTALTFHRGFAASGFADTYGEFHETFRHLESAAKMGRGVVLVGPHQFCHELFAAMALRHVRLVGVIRQETRNVELLERWYSQLGMPTILRPPHATAIADFRAMLRALGDGAVLGVTPDLPGSPGEGEEVSWLGRRIRLRGGAFWLAMRSRAPLVQYWIRRAEARLICHFSPPIVIESAPEVTADCVVRRHLQAWTSDFERELRAEPDGWSFWVDRRWTRILREPRNVRS